MRAQTRIMKDDESSIALTDQDIEQLSEPGLTRTCWGPWRLHGDRLRYAHEKSCNGDFSLNHRSRLGHSGDPTTPGDLFSEFARVVYWVKEPEDLGLLVHALRDILQFDIWKCRDGEIVWGVGDTWSYGEPVDVEAILRQRERLVKLARALDKPCPGCGKTTCGGYTRPDQGLVFGLNREFRGAGGINRRPQEQYVDGYRLK
jgi:hypothetical protein